MEGEGVLYFDPINQRIDLDVLLKYSITGREENEVKEVETGAATERRTAFYIRAETAEEIRITWRPLLIYSPYGALLLYFVLWIFSNYTAHSADLDSRPLFALIGGICLLASFAYFLVMFMNTRQVFDEVRTAMREGTARVTGNKWSLTDPQTVIIKKDARENETNLR